MQLLTLIVCSFLGFILAHVAHIGDIQNERWYLLCVLSLLAFGLYASIYSISLKEARKHARLIVSAVTIGVVAKALIIGISLWAVFGDPFFFILGIVVAQIDPLSVASLMHSGRLSKKAKTIIACWASFDDPVTVILAFYAPLLVAHTAGLRSLNVSHVDLGSSVAGLVKDLAGNAILAVVVFGLWKALSYRRTQRAAASSLSTRFSTYGLLVMTIAFSVVYSLMLGVALVGLFLRPEKIGVFLSRAIAWLLGSAAFLIGLLLIHGVAIWKGIALGVAAYCSQVMVGWMLTRHLSLRDRVHIAFAQQNGITAIILALLFEPVHTGTVAIVAPAVIIVNSLHALANVGVDRYLQGKTLAMPGGPSAKAGVKDPVV